MTRLFGNVTEHRTGNTFSVSLNNGCFVDAIVPKNLARDMFRIVPGDPVIVELSESNKPHRVAGFSPCRYFKRYWDEDAGGRCEGWGGSHFLFEVHPDGYVARQIELFDNGKMLLYDETCDEDEYGGRTTVTLDFHEYDEFTTGPDEFVRHWQPSIAVNRHTKNATNQTLNASGRSRRS